MAFPNQRGSSIMKKTNYSISRTLTASTLWNSQATPKDEEKRARERKRDKTNLFLYDGEHCTRSKLGIEKSIEVQKKALNPVNSWPQSSQPALFFKTDISKSFECADKTRSKRSFYKERSMSAESHFTSDAGKSQTRSTETISISDMSRRDFDRRVHFEERKYLTERAKNLTTTSESDISFDSISNPYSPGKKLRDRRHTVNDICLSGDTSIMRNTAVIKHKLQSKKEDTARRVRNSISDSSILLRVKSERKYMLKTQCSPQFAETLKEIEKGDGSLESRFRNLCETEY